MKLLKIRLNKTYKDKKGQTRYVIVYAIAYNDKYIFINPVNKRDYANLDLLSEFVDKVK